MKERLIPSHLTGFEPVRPQKDETPEINILATPYYLARGIIKLVMLGVNRLYRDPRS